MSQKMFFLATLVAIIAAFFCAAQEAAPLSPVQQLLMMERQLEIAQYLAARGPEPQNLRSAARLAIAAAMQAALVDEELAKQHPRPHTSEVMALREMAGEIWLQGQQAALLFLLREKKAQGPLTEPDLILSAAASRATVTEGSVVLAGYVRLLLIESEIREIRVNSAAVGKEAEAKPLIEERREQAAALRATLAEALANRK